MAAARVARCSQTLESPRERKYLGNIWSFIFGGSRSSTCSERSNAARSVLPSTLDRQHRCAIATSMHMAIATRALLVRLPLKAFGTIWAGLSCIWLHTFLLSFRLFRPIDRSVVACVVPSTPMHNSLPFGMLRAHPALCTGMARFLSF